MGKIKKLMFVSPTLCGGGAERVVSVLTSALTELGYEVDLVLYKQPGKEYPISPNVNILRLQERKPKQPKLFFYAKRFSQLRSIIKKSNPDVLIPFLSYQVMESFYCSRGLHTPFVVTVRGDPQRDTPNKRLRKNRDSIARRAQGVFLQNAAQRRYFEENCPEVLSKCFIVPNPINTDVLTANYVRQGAIRKFVTLGRLENQKNHRMLIEAFAEARKSQADISLDIYGEGTLQEELQQLIEAKNATEYIHLCGRTERVAEILPQYDGFVLASDKEGMPNSLMEAMGVGLSCISTDCQTGPAELLGENERGMLVPVSDKAAMCEAIVYLATHETEATDMASRAKEYVQTRYYPKQIAEELIRQLEAIPEICKN